MENWVKILQDFTTFSGLVRILLAAILGSLIGWNRGRQGRAAGPRTHSFVCMGAALSIMVGIFNIRVLGMSGDPTRIGAQVISGIGFLGAGTILTKNDHYITGLTTAAGLWTTAAVGLAVGSGFYLEAIFTSFIVVSMMTWWPKVIQRKNQGGLTKRVYLEIPNEEQLQCVLQEALHYPVKVDVLPAKTGLGGHVGVYIAFLQGLTQEIHKELEQMQCDGRITFFMDDD